MSKQYDYSSCKSRHSSIRSFLCLILCRPIHILTLPHFLSIPILHDIVKYWNPRRIQRMRDRNRRREVVATARYVESEKKRLTYSKGDTHKNVGLMLDALGAPLRRTLLVRLRKEGAMSLSKLGQPFNMKLPLLQKHILVLERAGLVTTHKQGRIRMCIYNQTAFEELASWILARGR